MNNIEVSSNPRMISTFTKSYYKTDSIEHCRVFRVNILNMSIYENENYEKNSNESSNNQKRKPLNMSYYSD